MNSTALCFLILMFVPFGGKIIVAATALCQPDKSFNSYESDESSLSNNGCKICNSFFDYLLCFRNSSSKIIKPHRIDKNVLLNSEEILNIDNNNNNNNYNNNDNEIIPIEKPIYAQKRSHANCSCVSKQNYTEMDNDFYPRIILTHSCDGSKCSLNTFCSPTIYKVNVLKRLKKNAEQSNWVPKELRNHWTFEKVSIIADCICQPKSPDVVFPN